MLSKGLSPSPTTPPPPLITCLALISVDFVSIDFGLCWISLCLGWISLDVAWIRLDLDCISLDKPLI